MRRSDRWRTRWSACQSPSRTAWVARIPPHSRSIPAQILPDSRSCPVARSNTACDRRFDSLRPADPPWLAASRLQTVGCFDRRELAKLQICALRQAAVPARYLRRHRVGATRHPATGAASCLKRSFTTSRAPGARASSHFSYFAAKVSRLRWSVGFFRVSRTWGVRRRILDHTR